MMQKKSQQAFLLRQTIVIQFTYVLTYIYKRRQVCLANNRFALEQKQEIGCLTGKSWWAQAKTQFSHSQITAVCCVIIEVTKLHQFKAKAALYFMQTFVFLMLGNCRLPV